MSKNDSLERLLESVKLLALDYKSQSKLLPSYVHVPDEVALIFDECMILSNSLLEKNLISQKQSEELHRLDNLLNNISENPDKWSREFVESSSDWNLIRSTAENILSIFDIEDRKPVLDWLTYVQNV